MKINKVLMMLVTICFIFLLTAIPVSAAGTSGTCGAEMTWAFDAATGTLTISGKGEMDAGENPAWFDCRKDTTSIVISEGVTSVSHGAFLGFSKAVSVSLPDTLECIAAYAFDGCMALKEVSFGSKLTDIGDYAFRRCANLTSLTIPSNVTKIGDSAFSSCSGIASLSLQNGITSIGSSAFDWCASLTEVVVPDSVTYLGPSAFSNCSRLSQVTIGCGVSVIENQLFGGCTSLMTYRVPDQIKEIKSYAFARCSGLTEVIIGAGVSEIDTTAFWHCTSLGAFAVSSGNSHFSTDRGVLYNKNKTTLVLMPQGFTGDYQILPGTTAIAEYACKDCEGLTGVTIPEGVTELEQYTFSGCKGLKTAVLPDGLTEIGIDAFGYAGLESIRFPGSLAEIKTMAFAGCKSLTEMTFTGKAPVIRDAAFLSVKATAYYPGADASWNDDVQDLYGGIIHWKKIVCNGNHMEVPESEKKATCTEEGLVGGSRCAACGQVMKAQTSLPAAGHSYGAWTEVKAPTEQATGLSRRTCSACGKTEEKTLAQLAPKETTPAPTEPTQPPTTEPSVPETTVPVQTEPSVPETTEPVQTEPATIESTVAEETGSVQTEVPDRERNEKEPAVSGGIIAVIVAAVAVAAGVVTVFGLKKKKNNTVS